MHFNAQYLLSCLISILCFSSRCLSHHTRTNENFCVWLFFNWNQSHYSIITFHFCFCAEADSSCSFTWCPNIIKATFQDKYLTFSLLLKNFTLLMYQRYLTTKQRIFEKLPLLWHHHCHHHFVLKPGSWKWMKSPLIRVKN